METNEIKVTFETVKPPIKSGIKYLNIRDPYTNEVETIDEFTTYKEAVKMLKEYKIASSYYSGLYISQRCTNDWKN